MTAATVDLEATYTVDIPWAVTEIIANAPRYARYRNYYEGDQPLHYLSTEFTTAYGERLKHFSDNICQLPVDLVNDRLTVTGFTEETDPDAELARAAWDLWQANRMDKRTEEVHREALRAGDGYVIVWPDTEGVPRIWPQNPARIGIRYSQTVPDLVEVAAKVWPVRKGDQTRDPYWHLNLFYRGRTERYVTPETSPAPPPDYNKWQADSDEDDDYIILNEWDQIPVFHFGNRADTGELGRSELVPVIPIQDALNKAVVDMLIGMESHSLPQRWATGMDLERDPHTGRLMSPFDRGEDSIWIIPKDAAKLGQFDAADLEQLLLVQDNLRIESARVSGFPVNYLLQTGEFPSGEAQKTAESRLVAKVANRQASFGTPWIEAVRLGLRQAGNDAAADTVIGLQWEDPTPRSELDDIQAAAERYAVHRSKRQFLRETGYSDDDIDRLEEEGTVDESALALAAVVAAERARATADIPPAQPAE